MSESKIFGREDILAAKAKRNVIRIDDVPGLGGSVYVRELKRGEFASWIERKAESNTKLVAHVLCDAEGNLLFDPENEEHLKEMDECFTEKGLWHIGLKALSENSVDPEAVGKNLQASLTTVLSSN